MTYELLLYITLKKKTILKNIEKLNFESYEQIKLLRFQGRPPK